MKTGLVRGIVSSSKTRVRCIFCSVHIPKANKCIEQHTNGSKHTEMMEVMFQNGISLNSDSLYCKPCNAYLSENESVDQHIESENHANWMLAMDNLVIGEFINLDEYLSSNNETINCEICKCDFVCTPQNVEEHVNSYNHREKIADKLKPDNGIFRVDSEEVWCKICDLFIENTVQSILDHIDEDEEHLDSLDGLKILAAQNDISIKDFLSDENKNNAFCNKCQIEIFCDYDTLQDHVISEEHKSD